MLNELIFPLDDYIPKVLLDLDMWTLCSIEDEISVSKYATYILKTNKYQQLMKFYLYYITMLVEVQYPTIVKYFGFNIEGFKLDDFEFKSSPTLVLEYLPNGELSKVLNNISLGCAPNAWTSTKKYINLLGIAYGMRFIHSKKLILRNLSPKSILLDDHFYPRISEFFFAHHVKEKNDEGSKIDILNNDVGSDFHAAINKKWNKTILFQSPEVLLNSKSVSFSSDVYSFSILAYLILTDTDEQSLIDYLTDNYFSNNYSAEDYFTEKYLADLKIQIKNAILTQNKRPKLTEQIPGALTKVKNGDEPKIYQFFNKCWSNDPSERWSFDEIIEFLEDPEFVTEIVEDQDDVDLFLDQIKAITIPETQCSTYLDTLKEAAKTDPDAMYNYANALYYGPDPDSKIQAQFYYKNAADKGHLKAMNSYGNILYQAGPTFHIEAFYYFKMFVDRKLIELIHHPNHTRLAASMKDAALNGNIYAQYFYGKMLYNGDGVTKNKEEAAGYFKKSADSGFLLSIIKYADMVYEGDGIKINKSDAVLYYQSAAESGNPDAKLKYGRMLYEGDNIKRNRVKAAKYIKEAADSGNVESMNFYGYILSHGHGVNVDHQEALRYYKMASDRGNTYAMHNYGKLLQKGFRPKELTDDDSNINNKNENDEKKQEAEFKDILIRFEKNIIFYKIAADGGDTESMIKYGNALYEEAVKYYTMATK